VASFPIVVLCSGRGSNLQALIDAVKTGTIAAEIRAVVSDKPKCLALDRARAAGIATQALRARDFADRAAFDHALFAEVARYEPRLVVLAGYMRVIDAGVVSTWRGRMLNIHPSLLPKYPGLHTHASALAAGDAVHGSSVHYVTAELDGGPVVAQAELPIEADDDADTLAARLLPLEHRLLVASVASIAAGAVELGDDDVVRYHGTPLAAPLRLGHDGELRRERGDT
jgi:phosphoribosylglycinamide formyltransferase-1